MAVLNCTPRTLRTRDSRPPSASAVLVPLHWPFRYDYLAGSLGGGGPLVPDRSARTRNLIPALPVPVRIRGWSPVVQRTPGSCSLPLVPVPLLWFYRYGYVAGYLRERRKDGYNCNCPRQRILPSPVPPTVPWTPGPVCRHFYRCSLLSPKISPRFCPALLYFLVYEFVIP